MDGLTEKQKAFCLQYIKSGYNGTKAYKIVYADIKNENVAAVNSNRLLRNAKIIECITDLKNEKEKAAEISYLKVADEYMKIAFNNASDPKDKLRALKDLSEMFGYNAPTKAEVNVNIAEMPKLTIKR